MTSDGLFDYDPPRVLDTTTASRMELEMLLAEGFGVSPESVCQVLEQHLADELYTVTYENKIVACVFEEPAAVDLANLLAVKSSDFAARDCPCVRAECGEVGRDR